MLDKKLNPMRMFTNPLNNTDLLLFENSIGGSRNVVDFFCFLDLEFRNSLKYHLATTVIDSIEFTSNIWPRKWAQVPYDWSPNTKTTLTLIHYKDPASQIVRQFAMEFELNNFVCGFDISTFFECTFVKYPFSPFKKQIDALEDD